MLTLPDLTGQRFGRCLLKPSAGATHLKTQQFMVVSACTDASRAAETWSSAPLGLRSCRPSAEPGPWRARVRAPEDQGASCPQNPGGGFVNQGRRVV